MTAVSVIGLGKLGACMAASMAHKGMHVTGVDRQRRNVDLINEGRAPVLEPKLEEMIAANKARLKATTDLRAAILETSVSFVIVPTPSDGDGAFSLSYVLDAMRDIGKALKSKPSWHLVVLTSTVLPGASDR